MAKWEMREGLKSHYSQPLHSINQFKFPIQLQLVPEPGLGLVFVCRNWGHSSQQLI